MLVKVGQFSLLALSTLACMAKASPVPVEEATPRWLDVPDAPGSFKPRGGVRDILRRLLPTSTSEPIPTPTVTPTVKRAKLFIQDGEEQKMYLSSTLNQASFATTSQVEGALVVSYDSTQTGVQNFGIEGYNFSVIVATILQESLVDGPYDGTTATAFLQPGTAVPANSPPAEVITQYASLVTVKTSSESAIFTIGAPDSQGRSSISTSFINPDGKIVQQEAVYTHYPEYGVNSGGFNIAGSTWVDGPFGEFPSPPYRRGQFYLEDA